ncbi:hypothetical protein TanjilG_30079 [Lupinus angustifolius]|uniref:Phytocyanin domain-containing protein n=1 Tax=Lupinus angustifolius TaxID=3871 RepID=A0A4P1R6V3_LUPAN|nr:PREDICTED: early nodulin-like protein 1 [Lupinus angustifolius]OIW03803.1 hypothetical protein TanjilG_30079 [Lupinus angustifolius]
MASPLWNILCTCLIIFMAAKNTCVVEAGRQFKVGDHLGWHEPVPSNDVFYIQWAERNRFQVGDSLLFEYQNDSVLSVEKTDYLNCNASNPITAFDNGKSIMNLDRPGPFYFISGTQDHCTNGQKLLVEVMSQHPIPKSSPSPSISLPPQVSSQMSPSPSPYASDDSFGDSTSASASVVSGPVPMVSLVTFAIVLMLKP